MAQKSKQWAAIIMMIALFAMIAFVTNLGYYCKEPVRRIGIGWTNR